MTEKRLWKSNRQFGVRNGDSASSRTGTEIRPLSSDADVGRVRRWNVREKVRGQFRCATVQKQSLWPVRSKANLLISMKDSYEQRSQCHDTSLTMTRTCLKHCTTTATEFQYKKTINVPHIYLLNNR